MAEACGRYLPLAALALLAPLFLLQFWHTEGQHRQQAGQIRRLEGTAGDLERARGGVEGVLASLREDVFDLERRLKGLERRLEVLNQDAEDARSLASSDTPAGNAAGAAELRDIRCQLKDLKRQSQLLQSQLAGGPVFVLSGESAAEPQGLGPVTQDGSNPGALRWSPEQALGEPDTMTDGDQPTAWASRTPDGGPEWLEVDFPQAIVPSGVLVRESYNPGAVVRIEAVDEQGNYRVVWQGDDPSRESPIDFRVDFHEPFATSRVRVHLDTSKVSGWNEIDAVGLLGAGRTHWAVAASASSTYADGYGQVMSDAAEGTEAPR